MYFYSLSIHTIASKNYRMTKIYAETVCQYVQCQSLGQFNGQIQQHYDFLKIMYSPLCVSVLLVTNGVRIEW